MASCSSQSGNTSEDNGEASAPGDVTAYEPDSSTTYEIDWMPYITEPIDQDGKMVTYYEDKFNVDFNMVNVDHANIQELLNLKFASGEIPDVMLDGVSSDTIQQLVKQGVLLSLDEEVLKETMPDLYSKATELNPNWLEFAKVDDKIYGLPEMRDVYKYRTTIVWRGDWLENVGINKTPETLEEFEEALYKFTFEDPDQNGEDDTYGISLSGIPAIFGAFGYLPGYGPHDWQDWFWQERDGEMVFGAIQPEAKEALALLNKWYEDGVLDPEFITGENTGGYWALSHAFINGKIGFTGHGQYYHWNDELKNGDIGANYDEIQKISQEVADSLVHGLPPKGPGGMNLFAPNMLSGKIVGFSRYLEEEPQKLGKIFEILNHTSGTTKENNIEAVMGIEGEMWEENEDGIRKMLPEWEDVMDTGAGKFNLELGVFDLYEIRGDWAVEHGYDKGTLRNALFKPLPSESTYREELTKIRDEAYISMITGDQPIDAFDQFVEQWMNAGGDILTKEANEWYATLEK
ncbi:putative aldouronate transport system substrate-binding protein [Aureibacillus halotolerans]|uniref:Putative aldouronate transport system substrate-binding protein n=2 Tax=Aureibacillus halotolerans TaxID=1508390 RepID=A0A4R6TUW3_9BACI|nr:putative aldouronate transport system substrate-binding protein [Aureibacillus halotolerans]